MCKPGPKTAATVRAINNKGKAICKSAHLIIVAPMSATSLSKFSNGNADGLLATCLQHEMDHLEGILFIDYLSKLKRDYIIKKLSKNKPDRIVV